MGEKKRHSPGRATNDMCPCLARKSGGQPHAVQTLRAVSDGGQVWGGFFLNHNGLGWQAKNATFEGVF